MGSAYVLCQRGWHTEFDRRNHLKLYVLADARLYSGLTATATATATSMAAAACMVLMLALLHVVRPGVCAPLGMAEAVVFLAVPLVGCARRAVCSNVVGRGHLLGAVWGSVYGLEPFAVSDARTLPAMLWGCARTRAVMPLLVTVWNAELSANKARLASRCGRLALSRRRLGRAHPTPHFLAALACHAGVSLTRLWRQPVGGLKLGAQRRQGASAHVARAALTLRCRHPALTCRLLRADGS